MNKMSTIAKQTKNRIEYIKNRKKMWIDIDRISVFYLFAM